MAELNHQSARAAGVKAGWQPAEFSRKVNSEKRGNERRLVLFCVETVFSLELHASCCCHKVPSEPPQKREPAMFDHLPAFKRARVHCLVFQTVELVSSMHAYYCGTHSPVGFISFQLILHRREFLNLNEGNAVKGFVLLLLWGLRFCCHNPTQWSRIFKFI